MSGRRLQAMTPMKKMKKHLGIVRNFLHTSTLCFSVVLSFATIVMTK